MHNRIAIIIISVILVLATIGGVVLMLIPRTNEQPVETEPNKNTDKTTEDSAVDESEETKKQELTSPPEGNTPIPDLEEGNEVYLDMDVVAKLQQMEDNGDEDEVNTILDTMLLLINEYVDRGYSKLAIAQVQRFYFKIRTEIGAMDFDTLCDKISKCIDESGANKETFTNDVREQFETDKDFGYVFEVEVTV